MFAEIHQAIVHFLGIPFVQTLVTVVHICTCVLLVLVVLIQSGKGAEISASFSGSSSQPSSPCDPWMCGCIASGSAPAPCAC